MHGPCLDLPHRTYIYHVISFYCSFNLLQHVVSYYLLQGYDTLVGEQFSTDLKQRIALARAAMHDPKILIIDDITSYQVKDICDNRIMTDTLRRVMAGRTNIILSQRLPIIQYANIIHVLQVISMIIALIIRSNVE
jgi:ABC-type multidrug transport system fused ATPase/permease subunit